MQNNEIVILHDDIDPFCDCPACTAELEAMLNSSLLRQVEQTSLAKRAARDMRLERAEALIGELERKVAALKERIGA